MSSARAETLAGELFAVLSASPERFGELARAQSACDSKHNDGRLGQLSPVPVKTRYGIHVVRVDKRVPGRALPCEAVAEKIADYLKEASWRRAFRQYVQLLAGSARISGIDMAAATTPLALQVRVYRF